METWHGFLGYVPLGKGLHAVVATGGIKSDSYGVNCFNVDKSL